MGTFSTQTGDFSYSLSFRQDTGVHDWVFGITYDKTEETLWEAPVESQNIYGGSGTSEAVSYKNGTLFLGGAGTKSTNAFVGVYQSEITDGGVFKGNFNKINRLFAWDEDNYREFGWPRATGFGSVVHALDNNCFVGAPQFSPGEDLVSRDADITGAGAIFCYAKTQTGIEGATGTGAWGQFAYIGGRETGGAFGCSFSSRISSITPLVGVGASGELSGSGRMYVYNGLDASPMLQLTPTGEDVQRFGASQASCLADGLGCIAVGYNHLGIGKINIYKESAAKANDYSFFQTLEGSEASYGATMKGEGSNIMVGAPNLGSSGAIYWYGFSVESGIFTLNQTLTPDNLAGGDHFGKSLDFDSSTAIIGSDGNSGSAYIYEWDNSEWVQTSQMSGSQTLISGSFAGNSSGSQSVIVDGQRVIIGTHEEDDTYVFTTGIDVGDDYTGVLFSGSENKIYDSDGNFLYGYGPNRMCTINGGIFTGGYYSIFINGNLCRSRAPREAGTGFSGALNDWSTEGFGGMTHYFLNILA